MQLHAINKTIVILCCIATLVSCTTDATLQTYFVDNELKSGFQTMDVPTSFLNIEDSSLTIEQKAAYASVDKLNMLNFIVNENNKEQFETELAKVKAIFENPKYEELVRGGNIRDGKFMVKYIGEEERLDELILFGYSTTRGFVIVRVLGNAMNATHLVELAMSMDKANISDASVSEFMDFFK